MNSKPGDVWDEEKGWGSPHDRSNVWLWGGYMYGCGLRLEEVCNLRVNDVDLDRRPLWLMCPERLPLALAIIAAVIIVIASVWGP